MAFRRLLSFSAVFASFRSSSSPRLVAASTIPSMVFSNPKPNTAATSSYIFTTFSSYIFNPRAPPLPLHVSYRPFASASGTISVGDRLPDATLSYLDKEGNVHTVSISELTKGKKVIFLAVPGAFTPTCSQKHLPGFVEKADELRAKGVDLIACVSVNDAFVLKAWADSLGAGDKILLLSDGNGHFTKALGVTVDLSDKPVGLGVRSRRYSLLAEDGVVKVLNLEEGGSFTISGADDILKVL